MLSGSKQQQLCNDGLKWQNKNSDLQNAWGTVSLNIQRKSGSLEVKCKKVRNGWRLLHSSAGVWPFVFGVAHLNQANLPNHCPSLRSVPSLGFLKSSRALLWAGAGSRVEERSQEGRGRSVSDLFISFFHPEAALFFSSLVGSCLTLSLCHRLSNSSRPGWLWPTVAGKHLHSVIARSHTHTLNTHTHTPLPHFAPIGQAKSRQVGLSPAFWLPTSRRRSFPAVGGPVRHLLVRPCNVFVCVWWWWTSLDNQEGEIQPKRLFVFKYV